MKRAALAFMLMAPAAAATDLPSQQTVQLHEVLVDAQDPLTFLRFRFIAPQIAPGEEQLPFEVAEIDMLYLCETFVIPYMTEYELTGDRIVISFMDQPIEFGAFDPDITQYFEAFRPDNGACIWDGF
ncbi:DUF6497 family protein [Sulfitobacter sp. S190]|uniref:DUF6497 family protein n=1 Tax=Sulfitobacter sp. S190 TaxID=2867022 RepID=UPI0021A46986|nr:DUF6497 family protein [Sulfitobacter sp. S190]UWR21524.1 hypothetical protein K3756_12550 [Sulfitobacter sp. S190]